MFLDSRASPRRPTHGCSAYHLGCPESQGLLCTGHTNRIRDFDSFSHDNLMFPCLVSQLNKPGCFCFLEHEEDLINK